MKALFCLAFFVACCTAALTVVDLPTNTNTAVNGKLTGTEEAELKVYRIWVPRNASSVQISISKPDDECSYLYIRARTGQAPCPEGESDSYSICHAFSWYDYFDENGGQPNVYKFNARNSDIRWEVNQYFYLGVSKYYSSNDDDNCTFSFTSVVTTFCPNGQIGTVDDSYNPTCVPENQLTFGNTFTISNSSDDWRIYSTKLTGTNYGTISGWVNSTTNSLYFYAKTGAPPNTYDSGYTYDCYSSSDSFSGDFYIYTFNCYTPIGNNWWYLGIEYEGSSTYDAIVKISTITCPSNSAGWNCTAPIAAFNPNVPLGPITLPVNAPWALDTEELTYFYYDVNTTLAQNPFTFTVSVSSGSGYTYIKYNGYPESGSPYGYSIGSQYETVSTTSPTTWNIYPGDIANNARIYFAVSTSTSTALTFSLNGTVSTTGAPTTGPLTTGDGGGSSESDATTLVASLFLVLAALIAALF